MGYQFTKAEKKNSNKAIFFTVFIHILVIGGIVMYSTDFNPASLLPTSKDKKEQKETPKAKKEKTAQVNQAPAKLVKTSTKVEAKPEAKNSNLSERAKYKSLEKKASKARKLLKSKRKEP